MIGVCDDGHGAGLEVNNLVTNRTASAAIKMYVEHDIQEAVTFWVHNRQ
jgi:hypothetical protein